MCSLHHRYSIKYQSSHTSIDLNAFTKQQERGIRANPMDVQEVSFTRTCNDYSTLLPEKLTVKRAWTVGQMVIAVN